MGPGTYLGGEVEETLTPTLDSPSACPERPGPTETAGDLDPLGRSVSRPLSQAQVRRKTRQSTEKTVLKGLGFTGAYVSLRGMCCPSSRPVRQILVRAGSSVGSGSPTHWALCVHCSGASCRLCLVDVSSAAGGSRPSTPRPRRLHPGCRKVCPRRLGAGPGNVSVPASPPSTSSRLYFLHYSNAVTSLLYVAGVLLRPRLVALFR